MSYLNFEEQVETLTGLIINEQTRPGHADLTQFIRDGILDVITTTIKIDPMKANLFTREQTITGDKDFPINSGEVIAVFRADGTSADNLYPASQVPIQDKYLITDPTSLKYRSKLFPAWYFEGKNIRIRPTPSGSTIDKAIIHFIDWEQYDAQYDDTTIGAETHELQTNVEVAANGLFTTKNAAGDGNENHSFQRGERVYLDYFTDDVAGDGSGIGSGDIADSSLLNGTYGVIDTTDWTSTTFRLKNFSNTYPAFDGIVESSKPVFPKRYERLVMIYAGIRILNAYLADMDLVQHLQDLVEDIDNVDEPEFPDGVGPGGNAAGPGYPDELGEITFPTRKPTFVPPTFQDIAVDAGMGADSLINIGEDSQNFWTDLKDLIEDDEDEIGELQINKIRTIISGYSETLKSRLSRFNTQFEIYKADLDAYTREYASQVSVLQKNVDAEVSAQIASSGDDVKTYQTEVSQYGVEVQRYNTQVQTLIARFNKLNDALQADYKWKTERMMELKQEYAQSWSKMTELSQKPQKEEEPRRRRRRRR